MPPTLFFCFLSVTSGELCNALQGHVQEGPLGDSSGTDVRKTEESSPRSDVVYEENLEINAIYEGSASRPLRGIGKCKRTLHKY